MILCVWQLGRALNSRPLEWILAPNHSTLTSVSQAPHKTIIKTLQLQPQVITSPLQMQKKRRGKQARSSCRRGRGRYCICSRKKIDAKELKEKEESRHSTLVHNSLKSQMASPQEKLNSIRAKKLCARLVQQKYSRAQMGDPRHSPRSCNPLFGRGGGGNKPCLSSLLPCCLQVFIVDLSAVTQSQACVEMRGTAPPCAQVEVKKIPYSPCHILFLNKLRERIREAQERLFTGSVSSELVGSSSM